KALLSLTLDFLRRERWVERHIRYLVEYPAKVLAQRPAGDRRGHQRAAGPKRPAKLRNLIGNLQRVSRGRPLVEHRCREVCQTRLVQRVRIAARSEHNARGHQRQSVTL